MSATAVNRRKVERYAQLLDESRGGPRHHAKSLLDDELSGLVGLAQGLEGMGTAARANVDGPSDQWKMETRARLIATIERDGIGATEISKQNTVVLPKARKAPALRPDRKRLRIRGAILVGLAVGTLALSGMSAASGTAVPGDTLYGIKRSQESAQLALASSDAAKGKLYLEFAQARLSEARAVSGNVHLFATTLAEMDRQTKLGVSLLTGDAMAHHGQASVGVINSFMTSQRAGLGSLMNQVRPNPAESSMVAKSTVVVGLAGIRAGDVENVLACKTPVRVGADEYGPIPARTCQVSAPPENGTPIRQGRTPTRAGDSGSAQHPAGPLLGV